MARCGEVRWRGVRLVVRREVVGAALTSSVAMLATRSLALRTKPIEPALPNAKPLTSRSSMPSLVTSLGWERERARGRRGRRRGGRRRQGWREMREVRGE